MKRLLSIMLLAAATTLTAQADKEIKRPDSYNYSRGVEAYDNDNTSEAIDYFNREIADNSKNGYAYMYLSDIYRQQEEPGKAIDAANLAIKYMPAKDKKFTTVSYTIRAQIQCLLKDTVAALSDYASAIKASPDEQRPYEDARNFTMRWNATTRPMPTTAKSSKLHQAMPQATWAWGAT